MHLKFESNQCTCTCGACAPNGFYVVRKFGRWAGLDVESQAGSACYAVVEQDHVDCRSHDASYAKKSTVKSIACDDGGGKDRGVDDGEDGGARLAVLVTVLESRVAAVAAPG